MAEWWERLTDRFTQQDEILLEILKVLKGIAGVPSEREAALAGMDDAYWTPDAAISVAAGGNPEYLFDPTGNTSLTAFTPTFLYLMTSSEITVKLNSTTNPKITIPAGGALVIGEYRPFKVLQVFVTNAAATTLDMLALGRIGI